MTARAKDNPDCPGAQEFTWLAKGTCTHTIRIRHDGKRVLNVEFIGGCHGNTTGVAALAKSRKIAEVIALLEGIDCQNNTSCPDQLAQALKSIQ
jgi:uncharacterized protein (TIGR03905 family)